MTLSLDFRRVGHHGAGLDRLLARRRVGSAARAATRGARRERRRPIVLVLDDCGYDLFDQVASALRRRGVGCVRLMSADAATEAPDEGGRSPPPSIRRRDRLLYDATMALTRPDVRDWLASEGGGRFRIADVLISETTAAAMGARHPWLAALARYGLAFRTLPPEVLLDKFEVNARLAAAGLRIPTQLRACDVSASAAARALGLPLVVKAHVGLGGDGLRIVRSVAELRAALAETHASSDQVFFQRFVPGDVYAYGCLRGGQGPLIEHGFRMGARQSTYGPGLEFVLDEDSALLAAGRRVVEVLGCQGPVHVEFLKDPDGILWPIDVNARTWDEISLLALNIDYVTAYADLLLGKRASPSSQAGAELPGRRAPLFPASLYAAATNARRDLPALAAAFGRMCWRGPGLAYGALVGMKTAMLLTKTLGARVRSRIQRAASRAL